MREEHKKFILENISKKSIKEIAAALRLKERKINKFLEKEKKKSKRAISQEFFILKKKHAVLSIFLIAILGFAVYGNSLKGEFLWDDDDLVRNNTYIRSFSNVSDIFKTNIGWGSGKKGNFWRPLQILSYALDYRIWRLDPVGFHLTNTALHILTAVSLYFLILLFFKEHLLALFTSLLFVTHPVHTEAVTYISGRADPLAAMFLILSFIFYIRALCSKRIYPRVFMILAFGLALSSRENSLIFPALLFLYHISFKAKINLKLFLGPLAFSLVYILIRLTVFKSLLPASGTSLIQRIPGFFASLATYLRLLVVPLNLHMEYSNKLFSWDKPEVFLGLAVSIFLLIYIFKKKREKSLEVFSIAWFFILILPHSNLYPINAYMAEHWLYLPSIGFFLIVANIFTRFLRLPRFKRFQRITIAVFIGLIAFYSFLTIKQNTYWLDPSVFYKRILKYSPKSFSVHNNLGNLYRDKREYTEAIASYEKAIEISPANPDAYYNLAATYNDTGDIQKAISLYEKTIEVNPGYAYAYNNLGTIYKDMGNLEEAITLYKKAIEVNPEFSKAYYSLGNAYRALNDNKEAVTFYKKAVQLDPDDAEAYNNLGNALASLGKLEEAVTAYKRAISIKPYAQACNNLAVAYYAGKDYPKAIEFLNRAIAIKPDYLDAYDNLGHLYYVQKEYSKAIASYKKALALSPDNAAIHKNLALAYYRAEEYNSAIEHADKAIELGLKIDPDFLELLKPYRGR